MAAKQPKKKNKKVFRSIVEFKEYFCPRSHERELLNKKSQDPESFGTGLVEEFLDGVRQELRRG